MTSEFENMDWDLEAVIRGWSSATTSSSYMNPISDFAPSFDEDLFFSTFPDVFVSEATADFFDELEGLYKPFYPHQTQPQPTASALVMVKQEDPQPPNNNGSSPIISAVARTSTAAQIAKYKRRKNQQKRVVQQARAEGLSSSDKWAWRKYGQKPIKGSPYPRSYYRCSSSKGCPARKQVEQSCADPGMYIITYTAEHNHTHPTRRNSLSGVARTKFKLSPADPDDNHSSSAPTLVSEGIVKAEEGEEILKPQNMEIFMPDIVFSDDLFPTLEDLHGCIMD